MKKNTLILLGVVAIAAVIAAAVLVSARKATTELDQSTRLFPELEGQLNDLTEVVIADADQSITLQRQEDGWQVKEKAGYRADVSTLRKQLVAIGQADIVETKTSNPELYSRLGVEGVEAEDSASKRIEMKAPGGGNWALIIGNTSFRGGQSTYVRKPDEEQSYSVSGAISLATEPSDWLDRDVLDIATPRIQHVTIQHPDGGSVELVKSEPGQPNFAVVNIPDGRALLSPSAGNSIAGALSGLRLEDVVPADEFEAGDAEPVVATYETFDGVRATATVWQVGDDRYVALNVERDPALVPETRVSEEAEEAPALEVALEETDSAEDGAASVVEQAEVDEMQQSVSGWVYQIPSYKYSNLTKTMEDLLKPVEPESEGD